MSVKLSSIDIVTLHDHRVVIGITKQYTTSSSFPLLLQHATRGEYFVK